jgi:hypothetical protein
MKFIISSIIVQIAIVINLQYCPTNALVQNDESINLTSSITKKRELNDAAIVSDASRGGNGGDNGGRGRATCLYQRDFDQGTKIISEPGKYKLCEDITFYPLVNAPDSSSEGPANAFEPIFGESYDEHAFGLGYFAALSIASPGVTLKLNGYAIQQSEEHALLQRFFAVVELANSPFVEGVGPAQFIGGSNTFHSASDIKILGPGTIGRSSHHGIHGNENDNVVIKNVTFVDFEVAAVSINRANRLLIADCEVKRNRHDVPVLGMFSAARFIRPYGKSLVEDGFEMNLRGVQTSAADVYDNLVKSINNVYNDVMKFGTIKKNKHRMEYDLFHNAPGAVDGPCYAFLVHGRGPAVGDFAFDLSTNTTLTSSNIIIRNNIIRNMKCWTNEVPAIVENNKVMNDARGAIFQLVRSPDKAPIAINNDGTYKGNVVADMQIMVAKAIIDGKIKNTPQLQTSVNSLDQTIISWASSSTYTYKPKYRCNGDTMHHVVKGMTVIRVEDAVGFQIEGNHLKKITNLSPAPFDHCFDYHKGANIENAENADSLQQGMNIRGISVAAVSGYSNPNKLSSIKENKVKSFSSHNARVMVGIDIQGQSDKIAIRRNRVDLNSEVGEDTSDAYIALRLRKYAGDPSNRIIIRESNNFSQETQTMHVHNTRSCPNSKKSQEWEVGSNPGGCPFGFKNSKANTL